VRDYQESVVMDFALQSPANQHAIFSTNSSVNYLIDFTRKNYLFVHNGCLRLTGYRADYFLKGGLESYISIWNKNNFDIYNTEIFPQNLDFLKNHRTDHIPDFIFSHDYVVKTKGGDELCLLQRVSFIADPNGTPIGALGSVTDITHFKKERSTTHTVERIKKTNGYEISELLYKKTYFIDERSSMISKRELEVLKWIAEGLASKQIAVKMGISINTVHNHRKQMLHKTNCKSTAELIAYAISSKIF
jgi:DNA-binding CsgD family transcriptional regulator